MERCFRVESLFLTLPIFHESFLLRVSLFSGRQRNIYAATLWIVDWNIHILWELVNRNLQKEIIKKRRTLKLDAYRKNSSISSSENPTALSLSLFSLFSSSLALRSRPLSTIAWTKWPGFCVYKAKRVIPIPKVTPSKNVSRAVDFISAPPSIRIFFTFQLSAHLHKSIGMTLSLSLKAKGNYPLPWYIFAPTDITSCYHNFRLQARVFARMDP